MTRPPCLTTTRPSVWDGKRRCHPYLTPSCGAHCALLHGSSSCLPVCSGVPKAHGPTALLVRAFAFDFLYALALACRNELQRAYSTYCRMERCKHLRFLTVFTKRAGLAAMCPL